MGSGNTSDTFSSDQPVHLIDDPELLLRGDFSRDGFDLVITGPNGQVAVIADYFTFDPPPNLMLPNGAGFSPELVQSLLHNVFDDALYAGPAGGAAQIAIGKVAFIIGQVIRKGANGEEVLQRGDILYQGDEIEVVGAGRLLARMNDGTTFRLGEDARAVLTEFEYDESAQVGNFAANVIRGGFSYESGAISKFANGGDHSTISTPTAVIGIRGSELDGTVSATSGETIVIHKSGILTITDINGNNPVELTVPGNTAVIVLNGNPSFTPQASAAQQQTVEQALPAKSAAENAAVQAAEAEAEKQALADAESADEGPSEGEPSENTDGDPPADGPEGSGDGSGTTGRSGIISEPTLGDAEGSIGSADGSTIPGGPNAPTGNGSNTPPSSVPDAPTTAEPPQELLPVPDARPVASDDSIAVTNGEAIELGSMLLANDSDANIAQIIAIVGVDSSASQGTVVFDASSQSVLYTASPDQLTALGEGATGTDQFTYQIQTGELVDTAVVTVTLTGVNDAPLATDDTYTVMANQNLSVPAATGLLTNDADPDTGDILSLTEATILTSDQTPIAIQADGSFDFLTTSSPGIASLNTGDTLTSQFSYIVSDAAGATSTAIATIVITGVNDAPVTVADSAAVAEASTTNISPLANDSDPEGDSFSIVSAISSTGSVTVSADGTTVDYTARNDLAEGVVSNETITYTVSDGNSSSTGTINVAVTGVNDPPIITPLATPLEVVIGSGVVDLTDAILATISDDGGEPVTLTGVDSTGTLGSVIFGSVLYDAGSAFDFLNLGETATDTFRVGVEDSTGLTANLPFTVLINGVADAPVVAGPLSLSALDNAGVQTLNLLDRAADIDTTDVLSVTSLVIAGDQSGVTVVDNIVTITPSAYTFGPGATSTTITLTYSVTDTTNLSVAQTATITITPSNSAPVVTGPVTVTFTEDAAGTTLDLLNGATDADGDTLTITGLTVTGNVAGITQTGNVLSINPSAYNTLSAGASETITYSFTIDDGRGGSVPQTANITITGVNDIPVAGAPVDFAIQESQLLSSGDVLNGAFDPDTLDIVSFGGATNDGVTVSPGIATTLSSGASVTIDASGNIVDFNPQNSRFLRGLDTGEQFLEDFSLTISDGQGGTAMSTFSVNVLGESSDALQLSNHDAPIAVEPTLDIVGDTMLELQGASIQVNPLNPYFSDVIIAIDTGVGLTSITSGNAGVFAELVTSGQPLNVDRDFFAFGENRFVVDDRIASVTIEGLINEVNDHADAFNVSVNANETLTIDIDGADLQGLASDQVEIVIFDSIGTRLTPLGMADGGILDAGSLSTTDPFYLFTPVATGTYTIVVLTAGTLTDMGGNPFYDPDNARTVDYTLQFSLDTLQPEEFKGNDVTVITETELEPTATIGDLPNTFATAFDLDRDFFTTGPSELIEDAANSSSVTFRGDFRPGDSQDWIKVSLLASEIFTVDVDLTFYSPDGPSFDDPLDYTLQLFDSAGIAVSGFNNIGGPNAGSINGSDEFYQFSVPADGDYFLRFEKTGDPSDQGGDYVLNLSLDTPNIGGTGLTILDESQLSTPQFRPEAKDFRFTIDTDFGINAYINEIGDVRLFGETTPANFETILSSFSIEGLLSDRATDVNIEFSATDNNGDEFKITSRDISTESTEVQLSEVINSGGEEGAFFSGLKNDGSVGASLITSGDFNGDGFDDFLTRDISSISTASVIYGSEAVPADLSLAAQSTISVAAIGPGGSRTSTYVNDISFAGDFNGDGFDDFLVDFTVVYSGGYDRTAIVFGTDSGPANIELNPLAVDVDQMVVFENSSSGKLSAIGDVNGDGFDDVASSGINGRIIFGQDPGNFAAESIASGNGTVNIDTTTNPQTLEVDFSIPIPPGTEIGLRYTSTYIQQIRGAGDVNGDGFDDLLLDFGDGAPFTFLLFGGTTEDLATRALADGVPSLGPAELLASGGQFLIADANPNLGAGLENNGFLSEISGQFPIFQPLGDINGDGFGDLLFNLAPSNTLYGQYLTDVGSVVVFGGPGINDFASDIGQPGLTIADVIGDGGVHGFRIENSELQNSAFPQNIVFAGAEQIGDINGDGFDDLLIATAVSINYGYDHSSPIEIQGDPVILYGGPSLSTTNGSLDVSNLSGSQGFELRSGFQNYDNDQSPTFDSVGDFNGDGFNDFALFDDTLNNPAGPGLVTGLGQNQPGTVLVFGDSGVGTPDNAFTGTAGDDQFPAFPGSQILRAGAGDDAYIYDAADGLVDGGSGNDAVIADSLVSTIDITGNTNLSRFEFFDLGGLGNSLILDASSIAEISDVNRLVITGSGADSVVTADTGWSFIATVPAGGDLFDFYTKNGIELLIDTAITNETVNVTLGGVDDSILGAISTAQPINLTLANGTSTLTEINGGGFGIGTAIPLPSGATLTVDGISPGSAILTYDPGTAFEFLSVGEIALDQFTFNSVDGANIETNTFRLTVEDPTSDLATITFGGPALNYTSGLFTPIVDPGISIEDVDSAFVDTITIQLENTSTGTTGFLMVGPDAIDQGFEFSFSTTNVPNDTLTLDSQNGFESLTLDAVEEFLRNVRYLPESTNPSVDIFITVSQQDGNSTSTSTINLITPSTPIPSIVGQGGGSFDWNNPASWDLSIPLPTEEVIFFGDSGDDINIVTPVNVGDLTLQGTGNIINVENNLTVLNGLQILSASTSPPPGPPSNTGFRINSATNAVTVSADTITVEKDALGGNFSIGLSGTNTVTIAASTSIEIDGLLDVGFTMNPTQIETPFADLSGTLIFFDTSAADVRFSDPIGRIGINIGQETTFANKDAATVIFDNADVNLTSNFILRASDPLTFEQAALELAGSSTIGGAFTFTNERLDFILQSDTVSSDTTLVNNGFISVMASTTLGGRVMNSGTIDFDGALVNIGNDFVNSPTGLVSFSNIGSTVLLSADHRLLNQGEITAKSGTHTFFGSLSNQGVISVDSDAGLTIENANNLLDLTNGEIFLDGPTGVLQVNNGDVVINNDTRFSGGINSTNVIFSANTDVHNGAAALSVDTNFSGEGLLLRGDFSLGSNSIDALVNQGSLDQQLTPGVLDFEGELEFLNDSSWNLDLDATGTLSDSLVLDSAVLGGEIRPRFSNLSFAAGDSFVLISALSLAGSFSFLDSRIGTGMDNQLFTTPGVLNNDPGTGLVANIVYGTVPDAAGRFDVTLEVKAVTLDSTANGSSIFVGTPAEDVFYGTGPNNDYQNIGAGDIVADQGAGVETFRVTALDFARIAAEEGGTNQLSLEAAGTFDFTLLPGTALENITDLVFATGSQQIVVLDDIAIFNLTDDDAGGLTITSFANEGDKVQLIGDFMQGNGSTSVEYFSPFSSVSITDDILVEVFRTDGTTGFFGTSLADSLVGTGGNDFFDGSLGSDSVDAQGGNDEILFDSDDLGLIDGGSEIDTLLLESSSLDLSGVSNLVNFEAINATDSSLTLNFADLFGTGNFLEAGAIDAFSTDPSFGDHQLFLDGENATGLVIEGVDILADSAFALAGVGPGAGVVIGTPTELFGSSVLPLTLGDVTIFLTNSLVEPA